MASRRGKALVSVKLCTWLCAARPTLVESKAFFIAAMRMAHITALTFFICAAKRCKQLVRSDRQTKGASAPPPPAALLSQLRSGESACVECR